MPLVVGLTWIHAVPIEVLATFAFLKVTAFDRKRGVALLLLFYHKPSKFRVFGEAREPAGVLF